MLLTFKDFCLSDKTIHIIEEEFKHSTPTEIQQKTILPILAKRDVIASSPTGSGKTLAFIAPLVELLINSRKRNIMPRALILAPTKEVAMQTEEYLTIFSKYYPLTYLLLVGGLNVTTQITQLKSDTDIIVATPGRLLDILENGRMVTSMIEFVVLDEADRMLDMGFIDSIQEILSYIPKNHQTLMFSATIPPKIIKLMASYMVNPLQIATHVPMTTATSVQQFYIATERKIHTLIEMLTRFKKQNGLIFFNRKTDVSSVTHILKKAGFNAEGLHGDLNQHVRFEVFNQFRNHEVQYLLCSDVAARGLDIPNIDFVINMNIPMNIEDYIHRIGRTGRAGAKGTAYLLVDKKDTISFHKLEKFIGVTISKMDIELPSFTSNPKKPFKEFDHVPAFLKQNI